MMRFLIYSFLSLNSVFATNLHIKIINLANQDGFLNIGLYNNAEGFPQTDTFFKGVQLKINANEIEHTFEDVLLGTYAVSVFHDENQNKILDKNFFGIPSEGYGFSNNKRPSFRAPTFEESKIEVEKDQAIQIIMRY